MSRKRGLGEASAEALRDSLVRRAQTPGLSTDEQQTIEHELALVRIALQILKENRL